MADIRRNWRRKPLDQRVDTFVTVTAKIDADTALAPKVSNLATLKTKVAGMKTRHDRIKQLERELKSERFAFTPELDDAMEEFDKTAGLVEGVLLGDASALLALGYEVTGGPRTRAVMTQAANLSATSGDDDGEIDLQWNRVLGANFYEIEVSTDPTKPELWRHQTTCRASKVTLSGLASGTRLWFRVRAVGAGEARGPWSDPATKMVP